MDLGAETEKFGTKNRERNIGLEIIGRLLFWLSIVGMLIMALLVYMKGWEHVVTYPTHWPTACPTNLPAVLVIGQSHASNTGPRRHVGPTSSFAFADGKCYWINDPMPGTAGRGGSIWPGFAANLNKPVVVADIAISGSAIEEWTTPDHLAKVRRTLADLSSAGFRNPLIIWMQGETNTARRTDAGSYYKSLLQLHSVAPDAQWLITKESVCYEEQRKWVPLDAARERLASGAAKVTLGPDLDDIPLALRGSDRCHFTKEGQEVLAQRLAVAAGPLLVAK